MTELSRRLAELIERCDDLEVRLSNACWVSRQMVLMVDQYLADAAERAEQQRMFLADLATRAGSRASGEALPR
jgi:hypothetical protein